MNTTNENTGEDTEAKLRIPPFLWKLLATAIVVIFTYHLTIAPTVRKAESAIVKIDKIASLGLGIGTGNLPSYFARLVERMDEMPGDQKAALRHDTRRLLENLAPVLDEIIFYYEKKRLEAAKQSGA